MNSYVDFTNQKSIVNPSSVLAIWCARCNIINEKNTRMDKKNFVLLEPEPEKNIQNGSGSKGPKKPGSGSTTLVVTI